MIEGEIWVQLEGERACPAVSIGWLSLSHFIMHLNDFPPYNALLVFSQI